MSKQFRSDMAALFGPGNLDAIDARIAEMIEDPASSEWLRRAMRSALDRDPLDALKDAQVLVELLELRFNAIIQKHRPIHFGSSN